MGTEIILDGDQTIYLMNWKIDSDFRRFSRIEKKPYKSNLFLLLRDIEMRVSSNNWKRTKGSKTFNDSKPYQYL
jgi:hypothetical protein